MPVGNGSEAVRPQSYHRAYKACVACRQRKSRCEVDDAWAPGRPCKRCKRRMKECVFPADRVASKASLRRDSGAQEQQQARPSDCIAVATPATQDSSPSQGSRRQVSVGPDGLGEHRDDAGVGDSVMRTMISSGSDAMDVLFDPVRHGPQASSSEAAQTPLTVRVPCSTSPIHDVWNACRFVKQGWFSAEEAIFYVDKFFQHFQRLSPILTDFYSRHENHYQLISSEPLLCCCILAISARYHSLPGLGGTMRSFSIHERLWTHIQHLILRVLLGQEKNSKGKTRTLGTIESLLLLTEWPPRSLAFPPPIDGFDSDLLVHWTENRNDAPIDAASDARGRWLEDVISPAKRTSHMSWMLISCAVSLACELGIFDDVPVQSPAYPDAAAGGEPRPDRCLRLRNLLYLYAEQISLQHGRRSVLPQGVSHQVLRNPSSLGVFGDLQPFIAAWIDLTQLTRAIMETLYSSATQTAQLLQSGRYVNLIEHFRPILSSWYEKHLGSSNSNANDSSPQYSFLTLEYYSTRLYCHSLCVQAIIERSSSQVRSGSAFRYTLGSACGADDYQFVEEVVSCSGEILEAAVRLAEQHILQHAPARTTQRIIVASIFLLKGLGVGVDGARLQSSLELLRRAIAALRSSAADEMQLGLRYASLLDMHLVRLNDSFVSSSLPPGAGTSDPAAGPVPAAQAGFEMSSEDWLSLPLPLDAAFAPVRPSDVQGFSSFYDGDLDFLWNLNF